jgi:hypothetical protein
MVIFRSSEGKAGYHPAETLEDAARFVERLRNAEGVEQARIFRLEEVTFEFKPYFKVEVGAGATLPTPASTPAPFEVPAVEGQPETLTEALDAPVDELAELGPIEPEEVGVNGRRGLFGR